MKSYSVKIKKNFILILAAVISLMPFLIACSVSDNNNAKENGSFLSDSNAENTGENAFAGDANTIDATDINKPVKILPDLPGMDFEGYEFTFLSKIEGNADWTDWEPRDIFAGEESGDLINDAVYKRNRTLEEKYNFKIKEIQSRNYNDFNSMVKKAVKAGDPVYDVVSPRFKDSFEIFAQGGYLVDLFTVKYIDFSKPWWNQNAPKELSIAHKLYATFSDLSILDEDATEAMIFNKQLIADLGLETPYILVKESKWTLGRLLEYEKAGKKDLDGNGAMTTSDQFGLVAQLDSITSWVHGCGMSFGSKDGNDYPINNFPNNEKLYSVIDKTFELMYDDGTINLHHYEGKFPIYEYQASMFSENRGLLSWIRMRVVEALRAMETDFGIIPVPKYDETQEKYYSSINPYTASAICIPESCSDTDRAGFILEAMSAESKYTLLPAYYELNLKGKYVRDDESEEMLDIIFGNPIYDVMEIYGFGNFVRQYIDLFRKSSPSPYMSIYEKCITKIEKDIQKCIDNFDNIGK